MALAVNLQVVISLYIGCVLENQSMKKLEMRLGFGRDVFSVKTTTATTDATTTTLLEGQQTSHTSGTSNDSWTSAWRKVVIVPTVRLGGAV